MNLRVNHTNDSYYNKSLFIKQYFEKVNNRILVNNKAEKQF